MTEPTGQFVIVGAQEVMVKIDVVNTVEMVDPAGIDVIEAGPETVEVGWTTEEITEDEAVLLG